MQKIESLVQLEAKKSETCGTIQRLLKLSNEGSNCFLCKQSADKQTLKQMSDRFPTEKQQVKIDEKIKTAKNDIQSQFTKACESHCSKHVLDLILEKESVLKKQMQTTKQVDQARITSLLINMQVTAKQICDQACPNWKKDLSQTASNQSKLSVKLEKCELELNQLKTEI